MPHLMTEEIEAYRARTMAPALLLAADRHLAACDDCRKALAALLPENDIRDSLAADLLSGSSHVPYEALEDYVDGLADSSAKEITEKHCNECLSCAGNLETLRQFSGMLSDVPPARATLPFWDNIRAWLQRPSRQLMLGAAALASVLIVVFSSTIVQHRRPEVSRLPAGNAPSPLPMQQPALESSPVFPVPATLALDHAGQKGALIIRPGTATVRFEVRSTPGYASYRASVLSANKLIVQLGPVTAQSGQAVFTAPAAQMPDGDYSFRLEGITAAGRVVPVETYSFSVVRF